MFVVIIRKCNITVEENKEPEKNAKARAEQVERGADRRRRMGPGDLGRNMNDGDR